MTQDWRRTLSTAGALGLLALLQTWWFFNSDFQMAWMYEFSHYADIGRSVSEGKFHSHFLFPTELAVLENSPYSAPPWPITFRFPLFGVWVGLFFAILGVSDASLVVATGTAWALLVSCTYTIGRFLYPANARVALGGALLLLCTPVFFRDFTLWGYADIFFGLLILLHHQALIASSPRRMFLVGLLGGLCYLARFNFVLFTPIVALYLWLRKADRWSLGYFLGLGLVAVGYRLTRPDAAAELQSSTILAGNLSQIGQHIPWLDYSPPPKIGPLIVERFWPLMDKGMFNLFQELEWMTRPWAHFLMVPFALLAIYRILTREPRGNLQDWVGLNLGCAAIQVATFSFLRVEPLGRYWVWMAPVGLLLAASGVQQALAGLSPRASRWALNALVVGVAFVTLGQLRYTVIPGLMPGWSQAPPQKVEFRQLAQLVPADGLIVSNVGVHAAWYSRRAAIDLPNSFRELQAIIARHPVKAVFIVNWPQGELYNRAEWRDLTAQPEWEKDLAKRLGARSYEVVRGGVIFLL